MREGLAKMVGASAEQIKRRIRNIRQTAMEACKTEIRDEDVRKRSEKQVSNEIEKALANLEKILMNKQKEILSQ